MSKYQVVVNTVNKAEQNEAAVLEVFNKFSKTYQAKIIGLAAGFLKRNPDVISHTGGHTLQEEIFKVLR